MSASFDFDPVDRLTAGAVGEPGSRTFYLQARSGERLVTLLVEKVQVEALARTLDDLLEALPETEDEGAPPAAGDDLGLETPLEAAWRAGPIALAYEEEADRIAILVREAVEADDETTAGSARLVASRAQIRALAGHALAVCAAGRPACSLCRLPIDAEGHACPAMNGHRGG